MGQRSHRTERCPRCRMHQRFCLCDQIPCLDLATKVVLVMHRRERQKPTATGPLALEALTNHAWLIHGDRDNPVDLTDYIMPERRGLILFPSDDARILSPELLAEDPRPVTLIVPDGSWRQASKAARRLPGVGAFENVVLSSGAETRYRLRREPKVGGLATMEAIARALGVLEGVEIQRQLELLFDEMVSRTLQTRHPDGT
ncbi:MAG: DTW domain-containing protein [Rhodobacterales bacterium]|nr:DTW domain-containing protein [Rhodobacterales bacterium]